MEMLQVIIEARSPIALSERKPGGQFQASLGYIPGAVLRGAVAKVMLEEGLKGVAAHEHGDPNAPADCPFCRLFCGDDPALFANAYPGPATASVRVIPATAVSCKRYSGFLKDPEQRCRLREERPPHGVFDILIERLSWEALQPQGLVYAPRCPACGGRLERFSGFYYLEDDKYRRPSVPQRLLTRVALNRRRGVAEDQLLYSPSVLAEARKKREGKGYEPTVFVGLVHVDGVAEELREVLEKVKYVGGGSSRGLGRVKVKVNDSSAVESNIASRIEAFNHKLKERWPGYKALASPGEPKYTPTNGTFFTIDLQADAILKKGWRPTMVLDAEMLRGEAGVDDPDLALVRSYANYDYRGGWNSAWRLPKPTEVIATMGSLYVFWTVDIGKWQDALAELEIRGLGERRAEGFGRVRVCDEFHLILREEAK